MSFRSVCNVVKTELTLKRSRFLCIVSPINSEAEALDFLSKIRHEHSLATHVCYAYIADNLGNVARFSDDGEPKGTAGLPMLDVLKKNNLKQIVIAVVRYFGGVKLGAGGLVRAYTSAAVSAIERSIVTTFVAKKRFYLTLDCASAAKIRARAESARYEDTRVMLSFVTSNEEELSAAISQALGQSIALEYQGELFLPEE